MAAVALHKKLVVVGDGACGKVLLLSTVNNINQHKLNKIWKIYFPYNLFPNVLPLVR